MQKADRAGIDFYQLSLGDQLVEIVAGGVALHGEALRQPAGGEDLAKVLRVKKIGLIKQKIQ